jgi:hypothetical protein
VRVLLRAHRGLAHGCPPCGWGATRAGTSSYARAGEPARRRVAQNSSSNATDPLTPTW